MISRSSFTWETETNLSNWQTTNIRCRTQIEAPLISQQQTRASKHWYTSMFNRFIGFVDGFRRESVGSNHYPNISNCPTWGSTHSTLCLNGDTSLIHGTEAKEGSIRAWNGQSNKGRLNFRRFKRFLNSVCQKIDNHANSRRNQDLNDRWRPQNWHRLILHHCWSHAQTTTWQIVHQRNCLKVSE